MNFFENKEPIAKVPSTFIMYVLGVYQCPYKKSLFISCYLLFFRRSKVKNFETFF